MILTILNFEDSNVYQIDMKTVTIWEELWTSEEYEEFQKEKEVKKMKIKIIKDAQGNVKSIKIL